MNYDVIQILQKNGTKRCTLDAQNKYNILDIDNSTVIITFINFINGKARKIVTGTGITSNVGNLPPLSFWNSYITIKRCSILHFSNLEGIAASFGRNDSESKLSLVFDHVKFFNITGDGDDSDPGPGDGSDLVRLSYIYFIFLR